jgi:hypothetical protein
MDSFHLSGDAGVNFGPWMTLDPLRDYTPFLRCQA